MIASPKKTTRLNYNLSRDDVRRLREAAAKVREPVAIFARKAIMERVERVKHGWTTEATEALRVQR